MNSFEEPMIKVIKFASQDKVLTLSLDIDGDGYTNNNTRNDNVLDDLFV